MIEVQVGNAIVEFPDGTPPEEMQRALQAQFGTPSQTKVERPQQEGGGFFSNFMRGLKESAPTMLSQTEGAVAAGEQGTTTDIEAYKDKYLGPATVDEEGNYLLKTPDGKTSPIDASTHVVLQDPRDRQYKVFQRSAETNVNPALSVSSVLAPGLATGSLPSTARQSIGRTAVPTARQLRDDYQVAKQSPVVTGVEIAPEAAARESQAMRGGLQEEWLGPNRLGVSRTPQTDAILQRLTEAADTPLPPFQMRGLESAGLGPRQVPPPVTMREMVTAQQQLGDVAKIEGAERTAATMSRRRLDDFLENLGTNPGDVLKGDPAAGLGRMQEANANYRGAVISDALDARQHAAELRSGASHSGLNLQNKLRSEVASFLLHDPQARNLNATQRATLEGFSKGTLSENLLRGIGKLLGGGGGLGMLASGAAGKSIGGVAGAVALPLGGLGLNRLSAAMTSRQAQRISEAFRADTPMGRQLRGPIEDWGGALQRAEISPTARNISRLTMATRNLTSNLKDVDIDIAPNDLLKSVFNKKEED